MGKEILIVEGDPRIGESLEDILQRAGWNCAQARSASEALACVEGRRFDLAVLDARLCGSPDPLVLLRAKGGFPVILLAPRGSREPLARLLSAGAEDYVTEPFEPQELVERIEVLLQRCAEEKRTSKLRYRELELDPVTFSVSLNGKPLGLTKQEFKILELMLSSPPGRVFSKQDFFDYAWNGDYMGVDKTVNVHICNIRKKLKALTSDEYIETIWGFGFRLA